MNRPIRFAVVGVAAALLQLSLFGLLINGGMQYLWASAIAFSSATVLAYVGNRFWTFASTNGVAKEFVLFFGTRIIMLVVNQYLLYFLVSSGMLPPWGAQVTCTLAIASVNYFLGKLLVFRSA